MSQLVRKASDVLLNALYLIGELGVGETPDAFMMSSGLELFNEVLDNFNQDSIYIPYLSPLTFPFVANQATYTVSNIISNPTVDSNRILNLVFAEYVVSGEITYPLKIVSKSEYYEISRLTTLDTRPAIIFLDQQAPQSNLTVYPAPDQAYTCNIKVKQMLDSVQINTDLDSLPPFYYGLLKYSIARKYRLYYPSAQWPPEAEQMYQEMYENAKNVNETDLTITPSGILVAPSPTYWWTNILAL